MKLASYVIKVDKGFAPNPFSGFCTLAACTPNRSRLQLEEGDWIVGNSSKQHGHKLVYAMRVSECLEFDQYFHDPRFQMKRPRRNGTWQNLCGDNIYFLGENGYEQAFTRYHSEPHYLRKDTGPRTRSGQRPQVYVSNHFFYFGENAPEFPERFEALIYGGRGCRYAKDPDKAQEFVHCLEETFPPGINGLPRDRDTNIGRAECRPRDCAPRLRKSSKPDGIC